MSGYSGSSGGGVDLTARLGLVANTFNDLINSAQAIKGLGRGFVDEMVDETGINVGASLNQTYDATNDLYNNGGISTLIPTSADWSTKNGTVAFGTGTLSAGSGSNNVHSATAVLGTGDFTVEFSTDTLTNDRLVTGVFDFAEDATVSGIYAGLDVMTNSFWVYNGDGTVKTGGTTQTTVTINTTDTYALIRTSGVIKLRNQTTSTDLYTWTGTHNQSMGVAVAFGSAAIQSNLKFTTVGSPLNMTLVSNAWAVTAAVNTGQFTALLEPIDSVVLGTDFQAYASNDGGTTWVEVTLTDYGDFSTGIKVIAAPAPFAAAGTSLVAKIVSSNIKQFKLHGWSVLGG